MSASKLQLVEQMMTHINTTFESRPGMLGTMEELNGMFYVIDRLTFILDHEREWDFQEHSWTAFLMEKRYIHAGTHFPLLDELKKTPSDFKPLQKLRKEYKKWLAEKL